jgi:hypothetical protein
MRGLDGLELEVHDAPHEHAGRQTQAVGKKRHIESEEKWKRKLFALSTPPS